MCILFFNKNLKIFRENKTTEVDLFDVHKIRYHTMSGILEQFSGLTIHHKFIIYGLRLNERYFYLLLIHF